MRFNQKMLGFAFFLSSVIFPQITFAQQSPDLKAEIFPKLRDRRCATMSLDKCNCPDAKEIKAYIEALIETGVQKEEIFYKAAKKFSPIVILDSALKAEIEKKLSAELGENRPQISLELNSFDFGRASKKNGVVKKTIGIYNKGGKDLIITDIKVSCSCTTASLKVGKNISPAFGAAGAGAGWNMVIEPNKAGELEIVFDAANPSIKAGKVNRSLAISSNDPLYAQLLVQFEVLVSD